MHLTVGLPLQKIAVAVVDLEKVLPTCGEPVAITSSSVDSIRCETLVLDEAQNSLINTMIAMQRKTKKMLMYAEVKLTKVLQQLQRRSTRSSADHPLCISYSVLGTEMFICSGSSLFYNTCIETCYESNM